MNMKCVIALSAAAVCTAPSFASDTFNWTGFHAGINLGAGSGNLRAPAHAAIQSGSDSYTMESTSRMNGASLVAGVQGGYDVKFASGWLAGLETDFQYSGYSSKMHRTGPVLRTGNYTLDAESALRFFGTARARAGYVFSGDLLVYGTAGLAYGQVNTEYAQEAQYGADHVSIDLKKRALDLGWTVGTGSEIPVGDHLTLRAEYLYTDFGSRTMAAATRLTPTLSGSASVERSTSAHIGRIAVNYAFN